MDRDQHEETNEHIYATDNDIERLDHSLIMKIDQSHLPVFAADDIPINTLGLPDAVSR